MTRLKFVAEVVAGQSPPSEDVSELGSGLAFMQGNAEFGAFTPRPKWQVQNPPKRAEEGDVLVSVRAPVGALNLADQACGIGRGLAAIRAANVNSGFLWWWLHTQIERLDAESTGSTFKAISTSNLENLDVPNLSLIDQQAIAAYLDHETQRIDELIDEQRGLIETLRGRKIALAEKVFGAHVGRESRLRWHLKDVDERAGALASELPLLSVSIDWGVRRRRMSDSKQAEGDVTKYKVARHGDIVLNRMRAFQGALGVATEDGVVSPDYSVIRTTEDVHSTWLASVMRAPSFVGEMVSRIRGIGGVDSGVVRTPRLNFADLREIRVVVPDLNQQCADVATSLDQTSRIDALIAESKDLIALSQERRAALITAAVTGQIDVRTAA